MVLKIFKAVWFLSALVVLANLLYTYASLPERVVVQQEGAGQVSLGRDTFFYIMMALIALVNALVFMIGNVFKKKADFRTWFYGLIITLNFFFVISMNFISLFNSGENFDYSQIYYLIFGGLFLCLVWAMVWPFYSIYKKFFVKEPI